MEETGETRATREPLCFISKAVKQQQYSSTAESRRVDVIV
jgi:hypothetical protein